MKVQVTPEAWNKMSYWAALGGKEHREFTCFGRAVYEENELRVLDVYLVKQEGTSGGVDGDDADINRLMMELYEKGIEPDEAFRCWIHSHPGTGKSATYLSPTDDANIDRYLTGQWLISIVLDSKGDNPFCQVDIREPRVSIKSEVEIYHPQMDEATKSAAKAEFDAKSSAPTPTYVPYRGQGNTGYEFPAQSGGRHYGTSRGSYSGPYGGGGNGYPNLRTGYAGGVVTGAIGKDDTQLELGGASGKRNGAAAKKKSGGAVTEDNDIDMYLDEPGGYEMLMHGLNTDELDAWNEYVNKEELAAATDDYIDEETGEVFEIVTSPEPQPLDADSVPEWVVSMADKMACTVEDLCAEIDVKDYDEYIDGIVVMVQMGHKTMDVAVGMLEKMGISRGVASKELETRVNA